jgi:hypothetical protein
MNSVPDLPVWLGVLKHRAPLARGELRAIFLPKKKITMDFCLYGAILKF